MWFVSAKSPTAIKKNADKLAHQNLRLLRRQGYMTIFDGSVRYVQDAPGVDMFATIPELKKLGFGECQSLAAAAKAQLEYLGIPARIEVSCAPKPILEPNGSRVTPCHVFVSALVSNRWTIVDPSKMLGMKSGRRATSYE